MSSPQDGGSPPAPATDAHELGLFGRYLTLWVALCIVAGVAIGQFLPRSPRRWRGSPTPR
jgi:ACR3 family arsenite efflux pump ArsB